MAASVVNAGPLNTPPVNPAASRSLSAPKQTDDQGEDFTKHLDQANGAAAEKTQAPDSAKPVKPSKVTKTTAKKSDAKSKADSAADENPVETSPDGIMHVPAVIAVAGDAPDEIPTSDKATEKTPAEAQPALTAEQAAAAQAAGATPTPVPLAAGKAAAKNSTAGGKSDPAQIVSVQSTDPTTDPAATGPAPTADALAKAQQTAAAFEAKSGKPPAAPTTDDTPIADVSVAPRAPAHVAAQVAAQVATDVAAAQSSLAPATSAISSDTTKLLTDGDTANATAASVGSISPQPAGAHGVAPAPQAPSPPPSPEARFTDANHAAIINSVKTNLLPRGGSMQLRLDPPELGRLQVTVEMRDGVMNASFQTSNEDATRLLSHSLGQLKSALESQGVTVEKIQVQQAPKNQGGHGAEDQPANQQQQRDQAEARQDQQRKEMLRKMWRRVAGVQEPVDMVA